MAVCGLTVLLAGCCWLSCTAAPWVTHRDTQAELTATPEQTFLYEGVTEHLTERAVAGLHGHQSGECYPENVRQAELLEQMTGADELRSYFFKHELPESITKAIEQVRSIEGE